MMRVHDYALISMWLCYRIVWIESEPIRQPLANRLVLEDLIECLSRKKNVR